MTSNQEASVAGEQGAETMYPEDEESIGERVEPFVEMAQPIVAEQARSGNLSMFVGALTIGRGIWNLRGNRRRALLQMIVGAGWIAIAFMQRRSYDGGEEADVPTAWEEDTEDEDQDDESIAEANTRPPRGGFGGPDDEGDDTEHGEESLKEPGEITGPSDGHAASQKPKEGASSVESEAPTPAEDVSMGGAGDADPETDEIVSDTDIEGEEPEGATDHDTDVEDVETHESDAGADLETDQRETEHDREEESGSETDESDVAGSGIDEEDDVDLETDERETEQDREAEE